MKRIFIVGMSSFIGANLARALRGRHRVFGTYGNHLPHIDDAVAFHFPLVPGAPMQELANRVRPDVVIYCAGYADDHRCSSDPLGTLFVHAEVPAILTSTLSAWNGRFIYFSTSKVFSGEEGNYREEDAPRPITSYGQAKYQAEDMLSRYRNVFILRLGTVFGLGGTAHTNSLIGRLLTTYREEKDIQLIADEDRSFLSVYQLADAVEKLIEMPEETEPGVFHVSNPETVTYFDFGRRFARVFDYPPDRIVQLSGESFSRAVGSQELRGRDLTLNGELFAERFGFQYEKLEDSLLRLKTALRKGTQ